MAKTTILAIFMVVLVLGMVMESQEQESCRDYIRGTEICQAKQCDDQCTFKYNGYGKNGLAYKAFECFRDMRREGNQPNQFIFPSVLTACAAVSARKIGVQVHGCIVK
ncbi:unnamed protein product, partial [Brassica rapa]